MILHSSNVKQRILSKVTFTNLLSSFQQIVKASSTAVNLTFVPKYDSVQDTDVKVLQEFISSSKKLLVLSGAGMSTESGIPDYRSEGVGLYARSNHKPIQYQSFVNDTRARTRYWARNFAGWPIYSSHLPNIAHHTLAEWEKKGKVHWLITQNVDSLHIKAGSKRVTELHGSTHRVMCLSCPNVMSRFDTQALITRYNPHFSVESIEQAPDGDVILSDRQVEGFQIPPCPNCGGVIKPDVVFFGDNVALPIVDFLYKKVEECDSVLVAGSSLFVYSGRRFVMKAKEHKKPIAIVNIGETRTDGLADLKVEAKCGDILPLIKV